jgi:dihydrofolate reductase
MAATGEIRRPLAADRVTLETGDVRTSEESVTKVVLDISVLGRVQSPGRTRVSGIPLGDDDGSLHAWMFSAGSDADHEVLGELYATPGAILMGRRMFDVGVDPWGDAPPFHMPVFVVTHEPREPMPMKGGTTYTFVSTGIEDALRQAKGAAADKNVAIFGGAGIFQEYLKAGLLDEMQSHLVAVVLGDGVRLFDHLGAEQIELEKTRAIETPSATHLRLTIPK